MRIRICVITLSCAFAAVLGDPATLHAVDPCPYGKLKWADFQGPVPAGTTLDAETTGGVGWTTGTPAASGGGNAFTAKLTGVKVSAGFTKAESWVKPGSMTAALLEHEQYHMDIYQTWALKLDAALKAIVGTGTTAAAARADALAKANAVALQHQIDCAAVQQRYDDETDHGTIAAKQAEWCTAIGKGVTPPEPERDVAESEESGMNYNPGDESAIVPDSSMQSFSCLGSEILDPLMSQTTIHLPPMHFEGIRMDQTPWMFPIDPLDSQVLILSPVLTDPPVLQGDLRMLIGQGNSQTWVGWIENLEIDPLALSQSPFLQRIDELVGNGVGVMTLQINLGIPLADATIGFTQPAFVPGQLRIGGTITSDIPAVSEWGMVLMALTVLVGGSLVVRWRGGELMTG